jgi:hypothetical protein
LDGLTGISLNGAHQGVNPLANLFLMMPLPCLVLS